MSEFEVSFQLPVSMKVAAKTLGMDLFPMIPMGISEEELREMRRREEIKKRGKKIQKILDRMKKENC